MKNAEKRIFFHPDSTVGTGIEPGSNRFGALALADYTAGGESHPALKIYTVF